MKKCFINFAMDIMSKYNNFSDTKIEELRYGLGSIYIFITKTVVICGVSMLLGIFKEMLMILIAYNLLRFTGFGLHAKKSWQCWISSGLIFLLIPFILNKIVFSRIAIKVIYTISILLIYKYAPADTEKRPIVSNKRRTIYKTICTLTALTYFIISLATTNNLIINALIFGSIIEVILISPLTYKIFKLKYNNYVGWIKSHGNSSI